MKKYIKSKIRNILQKSTLAHLWYYRYNYNFTPSQLCRLVRLLNETRDVPGIVMEIGCAYGDTTVFLNKHMDYSGVDKK